MNDSQQLTVIERASLALQSSQHERRLIELAKNSVDITTITNAAGYDQCHAARMVLKAERVAIEKLGKTARDDATRFSRAVIVEEDRLIAIISPEERRLSSLQEVWNEAREAEKQIKLKIEMERVRVIRKEIENIRSLATQASTKCTEDIYLVILGLTDDNLSIEIYQEFQEAAELAKTETLNILTNIHISQCLYEVERDRIKAERIELKKLRAEQEQIAAEERERLAQENARIAAERRNEEDRLKAIRDAEETRAAITRKAEQDLFDAENRRLQEERAKLAKEREEIEAEKRQQEAIILAAKEEEERKIRDQVAEITRQREELEKQKIEQEFREKLIAERKEALNKSRCGSAEEALQKILDICNNHLDYQYPEEVIDAIELIASATLEKVPV